MPEFKPDPNYLKITRDIVENREDTRVRAKYKDGDPHPTIPNAIINFGDPYTR